MKTWNSESWVFTLWVARHVGLLKLGSKPAQFYVSIRPLGQQAYHVSKGIIRYYVAIASAAFVCLHFIPYRIPDCSIRSKSFALCERQPKIPSPECSTPVGERIYIYIYVTNASKLQNIYNTKNAVQNHNIFTIMNYEYVDNSGSNIPQNSSCTATYHPSRRQSKLNEQDTQNIAGGVRTNS